MSSWECLRGGACQVITQPRATQRYSQGRDLDKDALVSRIVELATRYGRYGYRRVTALLKSEGWRGEPQESGTYMED